MIRPAFIWFTCALACTPALGLPARAHGPADEALARLDRQIEAAPQDGRLYLLRGQLRGLRGLTVRALAHRRRTRARDALERRARLALSRLKDAPLPTAIRNR